MVAIIVFLSVALIISIFLCACFKTELDDSQKDLFRLGKENEELKSVIERLQNNCISYRVANNTLIRKLSKWSKYESDLRLKAKNQKIDSKGRFFK